MELVWNAVFLFAVLAVTVFWYYYNKAKYWKKRGVKGPSALPLLGNAADNFFSAIPDLELKRYKEYGRVYGYMEFSSPVLTVGDPDLIKLISIREFHVFTNRLNRLEGDPFFSKILLFLKDEDWKRVRMIMSTAFTSAKMKRMYSLMNDCANNTLEHLSMLAEKGEEVNSKTTFAAQSFDTIARCCLGVQTNAHQNPNDVYMKNLEAFLDFSSWRFVIVLMLPYKLQRLLGLQQTPNHVLQFFVDAMSFILNERRTKKVVKNDFVQLLLDAETDELKNHEETDKNQFFEENIQSVDNKNIFRNFTLKNKKLSSDEILAQSVLLMLGGYHTTAVLLGYCSYALAVFPNVQEKLYTELKRIFVKDEEIDYETLNSCVYLDAFISECLRYYPPVVTYDLVASQDYILPNGLLIEKGVRINFPAYAVHHDPEFYENPEEFIPERFFPENRSKLKPCTFLPFGSGPRHCIGLRFAVLEAKVIVSRMVLKFKFNKTARTTVPPVFISKTDMSQCAPIFVGVERRR